MNGSGGARRSMQSRPLGRDRVPLCVGAHPSPTRAWSPNHLPVVGQVTDASVVVRMRAPRSCVQGPSASLHTSLQPYATDAQVSGSEYPMVATSGARLAQGRVLRLWRTIAIPSRDTPRVRSRCLLPMLLACGSLLFALTFPFISGVRGMNPEPV